MAAETLTPLYRRIPGRRRGLATSGSLWWADDHLLVAEVRFWTETYRRIYFRDIQAVVVAEDGRWLAGSLATLTLAILFGLFTFGSSGGWRIFWSFPLAYTLVKGLIHVLRGATCTCEMTTPVGAVTLPLRRVGQARRALRQLRPLIEAAQGEAPRGEIVAQVAGREESVPPPVPAARRVLPPPLVRPGRIRAHAVLCTCLLLDAMVTAYQYPAGNPVLDAIATVIFLACILAAIWALVAQHGTDLGRSFARFGAVALGTQLVLFFAGFVVMFVRAVQRAATQNGPPEFTFGVTGSDILTTVGPWEIAVQSILALVGLVMLLRWRRSRGTAWTSLTT